MNQRKARGRGRPPTTMLPDGLSVRLTPELMAVLDMFSAQTGLSRAAIVRQVIADSAWQIGALPSLPDLPATPYSRKDTA